MSDHLGATEQNTAWCGLCQKNVYDGSVCVPGVEHHIKGKSVVFLVKEDEE